MLESDLASEDPRILRRLEDHFARNPMKSGAVFSRYRLARLFAEKASRREWKPPATTLERFGKVFERLNALLDSGN